MFCVGFFDKVFILYCLVYLVVIGYRFMMVVNLWWIDVKLKGVVNNIFLFIIVEIGNKYYFYVFYDMMKDLINSIYNNMVYY